MLRLPLVISPVGLLDKLIWFSYLALAVITPLLFSTQNTELFEVPKMLFVYFFATIIFFLTLTKNVLNGKIAIPKNPVFLIFLIFIIIQTLSTFSSVDKFTSVFGYPSRLNGGLLSQIAYLVIFMGILQNLSVEQIKKLLISMVLSAFVVSIWGIPSHFGYDPTCYILTNKLSSNCWQEEFNPTLRIFSTLGQPNWLASYLILILPISLALTLIEKRFLSKIFFLFVTLILFIAFIFTNSRAGAVGLILVLLIFIALLGTIIIKNNWKVIFPILIAFLIIPFFFGLKLLLRVDDTIQIRQIVWKGALEIFKKNPLLGTGPETFPYSYYQNRPLEHNNTAEWNFFYNKAHNEFLNYLANIGVIGTLTYITFIIFSVDRLLRNSKHQNQNSLISKAAIAGLIGYQVSIFFGFSTVVSQLVMFTVLGCALVVNSKKEYFSISLNISKNNRYFALLTLTITGFIALSFPLRLYIADIFLNRAKNYESTSFEKAAGAYENSNQFFPTKNPFYLSDYAYFLSLHSTSENEDVEQIANRAKTSALEAEKLAPNNLIVLRRIANAYFLISNVEAEYESETLRVAKRLPMLAPTDPQSFFSLAKIQAGIGKEEDAKETLKKTLELKPDYQEAKDLLEQINNQQLQ